MWQTFKTEASLVDFYRFPALTTLITDASESTCTSKYLICTCNLIQMKKKKKD